MHLIFARSVFFMLLTSAAIGATGCLGPELVRGETDGGTQTDGSDTDASASGASSQTDTGSGSASASASASGSATTGETDSASAGGTSSGETGSTTGVTGECPPNAMWAEPATCPFGTAPLFEGEPGCYEICSEEGEACSDAGTCLTVQINPCPCGENQETCCDACGGEALLCMPSTFDAACAAVRGRTFRSVQEHECGNTPEGPALCHWVISFGIDDSYEWTYSDLADVGTYECTDGIVTGASKFGVTSGTYDPQTVTLTWDGIAYQHADV